MLEILVDSLLGRTCFLFCKELFSRLRDVVQRCMIVGRCGVLWVRFHVQFPLVLTISSGPEALLGFRASSCFVTPFGPILRD